MIHTHAKKQEFLQMESSLVSYTVSEAHPETLDYLSSAWCNFALQTLQENTLPLQPERSLVLVTDNGTSATAGNVNLLTPSASSNLHGPRMDEETDILPPWKSNDLKSWIWMQQALHPELNYNNTYFDTKRWFTWKTNPFKNGIKPIKKWLEDMKQKRKEESRLKRADVHGAISIAGVAAALAAIAEAENLKTYDDKTSKESVVASAAALVASQCAEMACALGASREKVAAVLASAKSATNSTDILTLTAAAATSIRGAGRLKARKQSMNKMISGTSTVIPIKETEDEDDDDDFDFEYGRSLLSKGALIKAEKSEGKFSETWVSIDLNSKAEVILKMKRLTNMFIMKTYSTKKECVVMDLHVELYSDPEESYTTCYHIVLETNRGMIKLDMSNDYACYKLWMSTVKHMLMISLSLSWIM